MKYLIKMKQRAGFTLVEALIVLAILGVLAAVAIPAYSIQLENSRVKVDEAALATAGSMSVSDYLLNYNGAGAANVVYRAYQKKVDGNTLLKVAPLNPTTPIDPQELAGWGDCLPTSHTYAGMTMFIAIKDGVLWSCAWQKSS